MRTSARRSPTGGNRGMGSKWIRPRVRRAIYHRDGHRCAYCERKSSKRVLLSLDHLTTRARGGDDDPSNLITACIRCNVERGTLSLTAYVGKSRARTLRLRARRELG